MTNIITRRLSISNLYCLDVVFSQDQKERFVNTSVYGKQRKDRRQPGRQKPPNTESTIPTPSMIPAKDGIFDKP